MHRSFLSIALLLMIGLFTAGADAPVPADAQLAEMKKRADGLHYQQGEITLRGGLAKIKLPEGYRYLGPEDAHTVITKIWDNPDTNSRTLGMLFPPDVTPMTAGGWGVIITYDEDGYVKDDDAAKIDYNDLLKQMKDSVREASKQREKKGYPSIELVGWAETPRYDANAHKMYWAKQLRFGDSSEDTLNYNIRMLGRHGVLVLNAVAGMEQLPEIKQATPAILAMVDFQEGHRYVDFQPSTDKVATYGLAALVAGGILTKAGFFKVLIAGLIAAKKFVIVALVAMGGVIKKLLGKLTGRNSDQAQG